MRKTGLMVLLAGLLALPAMAGITNVFTGTSPNDHTGDSAYVAFTKINGDFAFVEAQFGALTDTQTNALVNSPKVVAFSTNSFTVPYGTTNWIRFTVTNFAGMDYTVAQGSPNPVVSYDFGSNWVAALNASDLITNVPVMVGWTVQGLPPTSSFYLPVDGIISNLTFYKLGRADKYGSTNALYGQSFRVGQAKIRDEAVNLGQVQGLLAGLQPGNFQSDAQLNGHNFNWDSAWQSSVRSDGTNNALRFSFLGEDAITISEPAAVVVSGAKLAMDGTGTNCILTVKTNGLSAPPRLQFSHLLVPLKWAWLATPAPVVTGTNYVITFPAPAMDQGFFLTLVPSTLPSAFTLSGLLQLPITVVYSNTASTYGLGAGLFKFDGTNILGSIGTNRWAKWAPTSTTWP